MCQSRSLRHWKELYGYYERMHKEVGRERMKHAKMKEEERLKQKRAEERMGGDPRRWGMEMKVDAQHQHTLHQLAPQDESGEERKQQLNNNLTSSPPKKAISHTLPSAYTEDELVSLSGSVLHHQYQLLNLLANVTSQHSADMSTLEVLFHFHLHHLSSFMLSELKDDDMQPSSGGVYSPDAEMALLLPPPTTKANRSHSPPRSPSKATGTNAKKDDARHLLTKIISPTSYFMQQLSLQLVHLQCLANLLSNMSVHSAMLSPKHRMRYICYSFMRRLLKFSHWLEHVLRKHQQLQQQQMAMKAPTPINRRASMLLTFNVAYPTMPGSGSGHPASPMCSPSLFSASDISKLTRVQQVVYQLQTVLSTLLYRMSVNFYSVHAMYIKEAIPHQFVYNNASEVAPMLSEHVSLWRISSSHLQNLCLFLLNVYDRRTFQPLALALLTMVCQKEWSSLLHNQQMEQAPAVRKNTLHPELKILYDNCKLIISYIY